MHIIRVCYGLLLYTRGAVATRIETEDSSTFFLISPEITYNAIFCCNKSPRICYNALDVPFSYGDLLLC